VVILIPGGGEIGEETHEDVDQILVFTAGEGEAILNTASAAASTQAGSSMCRPGLATTS
jgi:mannose-6-phosphate isomerase-like protein (cupin superfamily)